MCIAIATCATLDQHLKNPDEIFETNVWNTWYNWNIDLQHAYIVIATYATSQIDFCNIQTKHLKHKSGTSETLKTRHRRRPWLTWWRIAVANKLRSRENVERKQPSVCRTPLPTAASPDHEGWSPDWSLLVAPGWWWRTWPALGCDVVGERARHVRGQAHNGKEGAAGQSAAGGWVATRPHWHKRISAVEILERERETERLSEWVDEARSRVWTKWTPEARHFEISLRETERNVAASLFYILLSYMWACLVATLSHFTLDKFDKVEKCLVGN
jgi:hypothetical protein